MHIFCSNVSGLVDFGYDLYFMLSLFKFLNKIEFIKFANVRLQNQYNFRVEIWIYFLVTLQRAFVKHIIHEE